MNREKAGTAGRLAVHLLGKSWFIKRLRPEEGLRGNPLLYAIWHGVQLPFIYTHRNMGIRIMISRSRDGSIVSSVCKKMGFRPVRGSSSRGGISAARMLVASLKNGEPGGMTPDGPRGPAMQAKSGISLVSSRSKTPVVPCGAAAFPAFRLGSWDRFLVPLPLARVVVAEGRPVPPEFCDPETVTSAINQQQARAELAAGPGTGLMIASVRILGFFLTPVAAAILATRKKSERMERLGNAPVRKDRPVWLHGASLGELKGLIPVVDRLRKTGTPFFITCTTPAGREYLHENGIPGTFLPLDLPGPVNRFLERTSPGALILAETEFWPLLLYETVYRGIPAALINGRLSEKSLRGYRMISVLFTGILRCFRTVLTRSEKDTGRFRELGIEAITAGDGKAHVKPPEPEPAWAERILPGRHGILVAGSTRQGEEAIVLETAKQAEMTPVIVPRHDGRTDEIKSECVRLGYEPDLWTDNGKRSECLIVNKKGILAALYGMADAAFVGGTLVPVGGHNILEPLSHGVPVVVGPGHFHFTELVEKAAEMNMCRVFTDAESGASALAALRGMKGTDCSELFSNDFSAMLFNMLKLLEVTHEDT